VWSSNMGGGHPGCCGPGVRSDPGGHWAAWIDVLVLFTCRALKRAALAKAIMCDAGLCTSCSAHAWR
jgi:hypothetical protein